MTSKDEQIQAKIAEQASDWFVENDERPLNAQESAALEAWFKASPRHIEEFLGLAVIARDLSAASAHPRHLWRVSSHARAPTTMVKSSAGGRGRSPPSLTSVSRAGKPQPS